MTVRLTATAAAAALVMALQGCLGAPNSGAELSVASQDGFGWIPFGPAAPDGPNGWYRSLEDGNCSGVTNDANDLLVQALAAVCRAAVDKKRADWSAAQHHARQLATHSQRGTAADDCLDQAGEALLLRSLAWHAQHPDVDPVVTFPKAGFSVACDFKVTKVSPAQGPVTGGTPIEITGHGLNGVEAVTIGTATATVDGHRSEKRNGATVDILKVTTPAGARTGAAEVTVRNRAGNAVAPTAFTYLPTHP